MVRLVLRCSATLPVATLFVRFRRRMSGGLEVDAVGLTRHGDGGPLEQCAHMEGSGGEDV